MRIPNSFILGGYKWQVKYFKQSERACDYFGRCWLEKLTIEIREDIPQELKEQTFLHELCHAIYYAQGKTTEQHDEREIDSFSMFLHQFLKGYKP